MEKPTKDDLILKILNDNEIFVTNTPKKQWNRIKTAMRQVANKCIEFEHLNSKMYSLKYIIEDIEDVLEVHDVFYNPILRRIELDHVKVLHERSGDFHHLLYTDKILELVSGVINIPVSDLSFNYELKSTENDVLMLSIFNVSISIVKRDFLR